MPVHVLNGDALKEKFPVNELPGLLVSCRECLIDGPVDPVINVAFWETRAGFIAGEYGAERDEYYEKVVAELNKLRNVPVDEEINLWFENDLFCQANLWFVLQYLHDNGLTKNLFRVFPLNTEEKKWTGFGYHDGKALVRYYQNKVSFTEEDLKLGTALWKAYATNDLQKLKTLSRQPSACFHNLEEAVQAHIDRVPAADSRGRPQRTLLELKQRGLTDFHELFTEFFKREGVYGFGDVQVQKMLAELDA